MENHNAIIFSPSTKGSADVELILVDADKIKLSIKVNRNLIYGVNGEKLVVVYGERRGGKDGYTIKLFDIKRFAEVSTGFISEVKIHTFIDGPHRTVYFDPALNKAYFSGLDLNNISKNSAVSSSLFCFSFDKKELTVTKIPDNPFHYTLPLPNGLMGIYGTYGKLIVFNIGDGLVKENFEVNFNADDDKPMKRFFDRELATKFIFSPNIGLYAWCRGGKFAYVGSSSLIKETPPKEFLIKNKIIYFCPVVYKEEMLILCGLSKENNDIVDSICVFDTKSRKNTLNINLEEPCCSVVYDRSGHRVTLIGVKTSRLFYYDLNTDKFSNGIGVNVFAGDFPILLEI